MTFSFAEQRDAIALAGICWQEQDLSLLLSLRYENRDLPRFCFQRP